MIKLFRDTDIGGSLSGGPAPIPEDVRDKIEEAVMSIVIDRYLHQKVHLSADVKIEITSAFEQGYSLSLPTIQAQEERIRVLEEALRDALQEAEENIPALCDVEGCKREISSQGLGWSDTGYWCICLKHGEDSRNGLPMPVMKQEAIDRENSRDENGMLPNSPHP